MIADAQPAEPRRLCRGGDVARLRAALAAASDAGLPELLTAVRTDACLSGARAEDGRLGDALARALLDLGTLMALTGRISVPVNAEAEPGAPGAGKLQGAPRGASCGQAISQAAYTLARRAAAEILSKGTWDPPAGAGLFGVVSGACPARQERHEEKTS